MRIAKVREMNGNNSSNELMKIRSNLDDWQSNGSEGPYLSNATTRPKSTTEGATRIAGRLRSNKIGADSHDGVSFGGQELRSQESNSYRVKVP